MGDEIAKWYEFRFLKWLSANALIKRKMQRNMAALFKKRKSYEN